MDPVTPRNDLTRDADGTDVATWKKGAFVDGSHVDVTYKNQNCCCFPLEKWAAPAILVPCVKCPLWVSFFPRVCSRCRNTTAAVWPYSWHREANRMGIT